MKAIVIILIFVITAFSSEDYYTLQLGAFQSKKNAQQFIKSIKQSVPSLKPFIKPIFGLYKVYVGKFNSYHQAKRKEEYLANIGIESFVNRIESNENNKPKKSNHINSKDRIGVQIAALRSYDGLKKMKNMFDGEYDFDVLKKGELYKLIIKCKNRYECKKRLYSVRREINRNAFITKYSQNELYALNSEKSKPAEEEIVYSAAEYKESEDATAPLVTTTGDNAYVAASNVQNSGNIEFDNSYSPNEQNVNEPTFTEPETTEKKDEKGFFSGLEVEYEPIVMNSRYFLYENRLTNSKIDVNGKKYSNLSATNSLGLGVDFYDHFFLTGKLGTRSSSKYVIDVNGKKLNVKVKYPVIASGNLGYKYDLGEYELYKLYLYSSLGTSITKKDIELIDFNNAKHKYSSTYLNYSLSGGVMMNFYNDLFFKVGASRDVGNKENSLEFSLSYEF